MADPKRFDPDSIRVQFNTRLSVPVRMSIDEYLDYMNRPLRERIPESEDWPTTIVALMDDAMTTFFADHPTRLRKGPKSPKRKGS